MAISAKEVKELRDKTGAGMMDCKKALVAADGDLEKALENLRKAGIAKAEKKASRAVKEGKVFAKISDDKKTAVLVEVMCETDFVATNDIFGNFVDGIADAALAQNAEGCVIDAVLEAKDAELKDMIAKIGENMKILRAYKWTTEGQFVSYIHAGGKVGVLVDVEGEADAEFLNMLGMHIAAFNPPYVRPEDVPAEMIEKEKEIATAQLAGKPAEMIEKILVGKINKWYTEVCLVKQAWIKDDKMAVEKVAPKANIKRFLRWELGSEL
ncbi:translation elongation factor Ts [Lentisphaerota bacterium WC36G]|nr:translation elongation factor Ts [Lentisphaerae bacterium WC36]